MRNNFLLVFILCALSFVIGYLLGAVNFSWMSKGHENEVAFMSMVGGWVSGLATLLAVIVSLLLAYQASQNSTENIEVIADPTIDSDGLTAINIKNLRNITTPLKEIYLSFDGIKYEKEISSLKHKGDFFPWTFQQLGESYTFEFYIDNSFRFQQVYREFASRGNPTFKKGYYIIETAMKRYKAKIPDEHLKRMQSFYEMAIKKQKK